MPPETIIVNSRKYDRRVRRSWNCELLKRDGTMLLFVGIFEQDVTHPDLGYIKRGTVSYEYYWLDRWYSIFCFHEPDGTFRNYYCNINMPPVFDNGVLDYVDLDIDILVWPGSKYQILDEEEYRQNALKFGYTETVKASVADALIELIAVIKKGKLPVPDDFLPRAA